jgi:lipopolysaccharide assembly outer membrane protein LptD (OstA)
MYVTLDMDDGRVIIITSDKGTYNKVTYDCFFENNVKAIDGETTVLSENIDLLATEKSATVYNNVFLTNDKGSLRADKVYYDFETKYYLVSMFNNEKVKIKLIK